MMPALHPSGKSAYEGSQAQSILWVGIFIMGTLVITPLILACTCLLKKISCPEPLDHRDFCPVKQSVVFNAKEIIDGRVKRRIESLVQERQFGMDDPVLQSKYQPAYDDGAIQNISKSIQTSLTSEKNSKVGRVPKAGQNKLQLHRNVYENTISRPTFSFNRARTKSQNSCCSTYKNSSAIILHKSVSSPFPACVSKSQQSANKQIELPRIMMDALQPEIQEDRGQSCSKISCRYDSGYCARLQSLLIFEAERQ